MRSRWERIRKQGATTFLYLVDPPRGVLEACVSNSSLASSWDVTIWQREGLPALKTWAESERAAKRRALDLVRRLAR